MDRACDVIAAMLAAHTSTQAVELLPWIYVRIAHRFQQIHKAARNNRTATGTDSVRSSGENGGVPGTDVTLTSMGAHQPIPPTPAIREWAKQQFGEEEALAGLREILETGGQELRDFFHELERTADRP
ncbi:MAG TPA: hypothetical protein VKE40_16805 [Gemmataceae bacterium]|nr:hypothetical protein [Gemmataceae bacterium]